MGVVAIFQFCMHATGGFYKGCAVVLHYKLKLSVTVYRGVSVVDDLAHEITIKESFSNN